MRTYLAKPEEITRKWYVVDANGNTRTYTFVDGLTTRVTVKDSAGNVVLAYSQVFDNLMNGTKRLDAEGRVVAEAFYDGGFAFLPGTVFDGNRRSTHRQYDQYGNLTTYSRSDGTAVGA